MKYLSLLSLLMLLSSGLQAQDTPNGQALHEANCVACHSNMTGGDGSALYTRDDRRVSTSDGLTAQVKRCESNLGLRWFDDEVTAVVNYLNDTYYHLSKTP